MAATLKELEKRVARVEQELARLQSLVKESKREETPAERGARLLAQARRDKPRLKRAVAKAFEEMGIPRGAVPPDQLRKMMAESGIKPEENLFSRGIIEMRDE